MPRPGQMPDMLFEMNVPPWSPKSPVKLAEINPAFGDATANGIVSLGGAARFEAGKLTTGVQLLLENGSFQWPELKLDAENIRLDLRFNDLLGMNTPGARVSGSAASAAATSISAMRPFSSISPRRNRPISNAPASNGAAGPSWSTRSG